MLLAFLLIASVADWVPARWYSADPQSIELIKQTPVNCVLLEHEQWAGAFAAKAAEQGIATLGVIHPGGDALEAARRAVSLKFAGVVLEGDFDDATLQHLRQTLSDSKILTIELPFRTRIHLNSHAPVIGTFQGLWPGINIQEDGSTKAAPSGGPWIDTNSGLLRFLRAATDASIWIGNLPPPKSVIPVARYLQAVGDAAIVGARWIVALDADFRTRLLKRDPAAVKDWNRIGAHLKFFEDHKEWAALHPHGLLAIVQDIDSGALLSGGVLDMITVKHTPVRPVPTRHLSDDAMKGAHLAVDVDPSSLTNEQKEVLRRFTRGGNTLLSAPPGWKFPPQRPGQMTVDKDDVDKLDAIWKEVNSLTGRRNLGVRLFNVSSMLSSLVGTPDGKKLVLYLVNFSDYPVEQVAVHILGKYRHARLYTPETAPKDLEVYDTDEGTGIDIAKVSVLATLELE